MALARLHGGPLDGQVLPIATVDDDRLIIPYGSTQIVYTRVGEPINTGPDDGPTEASYWYVDDGDDFGVSDD